MTLKRKKTEFSKKKEKKEDRRGRGHGNIT
jgi:hypothetical protein